RRDDQLADVLRDHGPRVRRKAAVGDERVDLVEARDPAQPPNAPLRMVGDDDDAVGGADQRLVRLRLEQFRRRQARVVAQPLAALAISSFSSSCRCDFASKPGASVLGRPRTVAPPCTLSTSPEEASTSRSRRIVMSETASSSVSSLTRTAPRRRISSTISCWRCPASIADAQYSTRPNNPRPGPKLLCSPGLDICRAIVPVYAGFP